MKFWVPQLAQAKLVGDSSSSTLPVASSGIFVGTRYRTSSFSAVVQVIETNRAVSYRQYNAGLTLTGIPIILLSECCQKLHDVRDVLIGQGQVYDGGGGKRCKIESDVSHEYYCKVGLLSDDRQRLELLI